jgi:23S rRNA pseudouridine1911/1915/1917 synthase
MTEKNWPLVGDGTYKRRNTRVPASIKPWIDPEGSRPMLHAWKLSLVHPSSGEVTSFVAKPPEDMMSCLRALAFESILSEKIRD